MLKLNQFSINLYNYRSFIFGAVKRELQIQCKNSLLGWVWLLFNSLSLTLMYALIFNNVMGVKLPGQSSAFSYSIYLCAGLLPWNYFVTVLNRNVTVFVDNANIIKKNFFPHLTLTLIILFSETVNFLLALSVFVIFLISIGHFPGWKMIGMIPLLLTQQILAMSIGTFLALFHVFYRDIGKSMAIILQFWFWLTPIIYVDTILPDAMRNMILLLNPMTSLINGYHKIILYHEWPSLFHCLPCILLALILSWIAYIAFNKLSADIVDEL